jgi:hypothetical protein
MRCKYFPAFSGKKRESQAVESAAHTTSLYLSYLIMFLDAFQYLSAAILFPRTKA